MEEKKPNVCCNKTEKLLKQLLTLLNEKFLKHLELLETCLEYQKAIIDVLWVLSQRFLILTRGAICVRPYPPEPSEREEMEIRSLFDDQKKELKSSNRKMAIALGILKLTCKKFDKSMTDTIDVNLPNLFVEATTERRSIFFYIEFFADFMQYLKDVQSKLKLLENSLFIDDIKAILEYKSNLDLDPIEIDHFKNTMSEPIHPEIKSCTRTMDKI